MLFNLAFKSLLNRKSAVILTVVSITVGILLLISFSFIKDQVRTSFSKTINGIDLIVGSKTSDINLLLYSVFHVGSATNNISWDGYQKLKNDQSVSWAIPISLGDSHAGYRVIGTSDAYLKHYRFGNKQAMNFEQGEWFIHPFDIVLGQEVAEKLNYQVGDLISLSHGVSKTSFKKHDQIGFKVTGILNNTGTPIDQSLFVSLTGLEAVHLNWPKTEPEQQHLIQYIEENGLQPKSITATFLALKNKSSTFVVQRKINQNSDEPLQAVLPGVALAQLWNLSKMFEQSLWLVGVLVFVTTIIGMINMLIVSLQSRKKELALLRIIGASPMYCFLLVQIESFLVVLTAILMALAFGYLIFWLLGDWFGTQYGIYVDLQSYLSIDLLIIFAVLSLASIILVCIPATMFYRQSIVKNINH